MSSITRASVLSVLLTVSVACSGRAEHVVLRGYFDLCAAADAVALANVALVTLDPVRDGVVGRFRVVRVGSPVSHHSPADGRAILLSLAEPGRDHQTDSAVLISQDVHLQAEIHRDGRHAERPIVVTLARARTSEALGRWVVIRLVLDGRTVPEASSDRR